MIWSRSMARSFGVGFMFFFVFYRVYILGNCFVWDCICFGTTVRLKMFETQRYSSGKKKILTANKKHERMLYSYFASIHNVYYIDGLKKNQAYGPLKYCQKIRCVVSIFLSQSVHIIPPFAFVFKTGRVSML